MEVVEVLVGRTMALDSATSAISQGTLLENAPNECTQQLMEAVAPLEFVVLT